MNTVKLIYLIFFFIFQEINQAITVTIENGIYKNVVIGVSTRIENDKLRELVNKLQETMEKSSKFLCEATFGYASFGSVRFIVPSNWVSPDSNIEIKAAKDERFDSAEIQINDVGSSFFVQQVNVCGERGKFIQIPIDKLLDNNQILEKELVVMWGRLRYGVYSEYDRGIYYNPKTGSQPNSCTDLPLNWKPKNSCTDDDTCEVIVESSDNTHISSSVLYDVTLEKIKYFCNESTHNSYSNTPHNRICNGKSSWEVIEENEDFIEKPKQNCDTLSSVQIEVIQRKCHRIFIGLAIDSLIDVDVGKTIEVSLVSLALSTSAQDTILTVINNDTIVFDDTFDSNTAKKLSEQLNNKVLKPNSCTTCVLNTVREAINNGSSNPCEYTLVLLTNANSVPKPPTPPPTTVEEGSGIESTTVTTIKTVFKREIVQFEEDIEDLSSEFLLIRKERATPQSPDEILAQFLKDSGVKIFGVVIGTNSTKSTDDSLEDLIKFTGGNVLNVESLSHDRLTEVLIPLLNEVENEEKSVIKQEKQETNNKTIESHIMQFKFDEDGDVKFIIYHNNATTLKNVSFTNNESNSYFNKTSCKEFQSQKLTSCEIKNLKKGEWVLTIELPNPSPISVKVNVKKVPKKDEVKIVNPFTEPSLKVDLGSGEKLQFFVRLQQGPFTIENARVTASLGKSIPIELKNDELNPDGSKTGVYTGSINSCTSSGRFSIKYVAESTNQTCVRNQNNCDPLNLSSNIHSEGSINILSCRSSDQLSGNDITDLRLQLRANSSEGVFSWTETWEKKNVLTHKLRLLNKFVTDKDYFQWKGSNELKDLLPNFGLMGVKRNETIDLKPFNGDLTVAIITTGKAGDAELSNLVRIKKDLPETTTTTTETSPTTTTETSPTATTETSPTTTTTETSPTTTTTETSPTTTTETNSTTTTGIPKLKGGDKASDLSNYPHVIAGIVVTSVFIVGGVAILLVMIKLQLRKHRILPEESDS